MATEQGYPVFKLTDSNNANVFEVPSFGGVPSQGCVGAPSFLCRTVISAAQLLALKTTPVVLLAIAPQPAQANAIISLDGIAMHYIFTTAAFTLNAGTLQLFYGPPANALSMCADQAAVLTNVANRVIPAIIPTAIAAQTEALGLVQTIQLGNTGAANFTVGGGSLVVTFSYNIMQL